MPQPYPNGELLIVMDCSDLDRSARFWTDVLGYAAGPAASGPYRGLTPVSGAGIDVLLQRVPDGIQWEVATTGGGHGQARSDLLQAQPAA